MANERGNNGEHMSIGIFKPPDFAERNRWFGGVPGRWAKEYISYGSTLGP